MNTINMNEYKFAEYPSNSSVASGVTMLVAGWFLVAAGAILADPASPYTARPVVTVENTANFMVGEENQGPREQRVAMAGPDARFTITVEAKRLKV